MHGSNIIKTKFDADKSLKLCFCREQEGNSLCSKAFVCFRVGTDVCYICKKNVFAESKKETVYVQQPLYVFVLEQMFVIYAKKMKIERQKLKRKHESGDDWVQTNSCVNIKLLTPTSRDKSLGRARKEGYQLKLKTSKCYGQD